MKAIQTIAFLTFKEAIRNKILYILFFFAFGLISLSWVIGELTVGDEMKIVKDLGLASIHFFGVLITIFLGVSLVFREMEKRTVYLVLSKPLKRYHFLAGKLAGLALTQLLVLVALVAMFFLVLGLKGQTDSRMLLAFYAIYLEWVLLACLALLFSSFSTPLLSMMLTLALFLAGHLSESIIFLRDRIPSDFAKAALSVIYYTLPNLELFNIRLEIVHKLPIPPFFLLETSLYWLFYCLTLLGASIVIFQKKDLV